MRHSSSEPSFEASPDSSTESAPELSGDEDMIEFERGWELDYESISELGAGGMGRVYVVEHRRSGERRALKLPEISSPEALARFRREIDIQWSLRHPHIVRILDFGDDWFVMPLAVDNLRDRAPELADELLIEAIDQVAAGLALAHTQGFVHRDVKPANILLLEEDPRWLWAVGDFGLVRRPIGQTTGPRTHGGLGTPGYMAPEVIADAHRVDQRADVFSLGRTIAYATTGLEPRPYERTVATPVWQPLVERMTALAIGERLTSMDEVRSELEIVRRRVRDQRRTEWKLRARPDPLPQDDVIVLMAVLGTLHTPGDRTERMAIRSAIEQAAGDLTPAGVEVALISLMRRGFLIQVPEYNAFLPTEAAYAWVLENRDNLPLRRQPSNGTDRDLPF